MGRIIVSIVLLVLMTGLCGWSVVAVKWKMSSLSAKIEEVEKSFENGDLEKCVKAAGELEDEWKAFMAHAVLINDLGHALDITTSIAEIYSFAQLGNEELYAACDRAEVQIEIFEDMQLPTIWKIL